MDTRVREKGQVTLPVKIRESLNLTKDTVLTVVKVGDAVLLTRRPSRFDSAAEKFSKRAAGAGVTLNELLRDLRRIRNQKA